MIFLLMKFPANEAEQEPYSPVAILGPLVIQMIKSYGGTASHKHVALIRLFTTSLCNE